MSSLPPQSAVPSSGSCSLPLSAKARRTPEQPISFLISTAMDNPSLVNLAAGLVDPLTLPTDETSTLTQAILNDLPRARAALQYDTTLGLRPLRQQLAKHLQSLEASAGSSLTLNENNILITTGSQQSLYLIGETLIDPGDIVITENPSYFVYTGALASFGARVMGVPMDEHGLRVDLLETLLAELDRQGELPRVKYIYVTPYFQNPTGLSLSLQRRKKLIDLVRAYRPRHRMLIVEDAAYRELRYDGSDLPSIKSLDPEGDVTVYAGTFSKPFSPGIKTGYAIMPPDLLDACLQQKGNHDFGSAALCQYVALECMTSGVYHTHVSRLRAAYAHKRNLLLQSLNKHLSSTPGLRWTHPAGGLYIWLTLPPGFDASRTGLFPHAVKEGVLYVPGEYCHTPDIMTGAIPRNTLRLCFGSVSAEQIEPGVRALARAIHKFISPTDSPSSAASSSSSPAILEHVG